MGYLEILNLFQNIIDELSKYSEEISKQCEENLRLKNFSKVEVLAKRNQAIELFNKKFEELKKEWLSINSNIFEPSIKVVNVLENKKKEKIKRTKEENYFIPILLSIKELGGKGKSDEVLSKVYDKMKDKLTLDDLKTINDRGVIRWDNTARWARKKLVDLNMIASDSDKGYWEITEYGLEFLQDSLKNDNAK